MLAKAWLLTGNDQYVRELVAQWRSWIKANPYPLGINWGAHSRSPFAACRGSGWTSCSPKLRHTPTCAQNLLPALAFHGRYIERYLSTYFSPNTHLLGKRLRYFSWGTLYPQMPRAARWKETGWRIVLEEAERKCVPMVFILSNRSTTTFMRSTFFCMRGCWRLEMECRFRGL